MKTSLLREVRQEETVQCRDPNGLIVREWGRPSNLKTILFWS
jgi:hypothetical protein